MIDFTKEEKMEFKIGDWVKRKESERGYSWLEDCNKYGCNVGDSFEIIGFEGDSGLFLNMNGHRENWDIINFVLSEKEKKGKVKPIDLHLLMEDGCNNVMEVTNSFNEAVEKSRNYTNKQTIYQLIKVADVEDIRKVTKIKKIKQKKAKKKK